MEAKTGEGKRSLIKYGRVEVEEEVEEEEEEEIEGSDNQFGWGEDGRKKMRDLHSKRGSSSSSSSSSSSMAPPSCQVEGCFSDMSEAKHYHRRHKVCEFHAKAPSVLIAGLHQRFCQQCSKFHELSEFDDTKRSCRRRLAGHNERRRKSASNYHGEALY